MADIYIIKRSDGGVSYGYAPGENSVEEEMAKWQSSQSQIRGLSVRVADEQIIPTDRIFRNAWTDDSPGNQVDVDMPKAKEIWKNHWRAARKPLLEALDTEFILALEKADKQKEAEVKAKKQALRDVTLTDLSAVSTPEALKQVWPAALGSKPTHLT